MNLWESRGVRIFCAVSREDNVYVQDLIRQQKDTIRPLVETMYVFVSGSAKNMPDGVLEAFEECCAEETMEMDDLHRTGRYIIDTWS